MRRILTLLAVATVTSLGAAATSAQAGQPTRGSESLDYTFTFDDCGFPVEEHGSGKLNLISWYDASGTRTREIVTAPGARITWTNLDTGRSVTSANTYVVHKQDNPDGSVTVAFTGVVFAVKGHVESGRDLVVFSAGGIEWLAEAGPTADLCEALTAAIG